MVEEKKRDMTGMVEMLKQLDSTSLLIVQNSAEVLLARDRIEAAKREKDLQKA